MVNSLPKKDVPNRKSPMNLFCHEKSYDSMKDNIGQWKKPWPEKWKKKSEREEQVSNSMGKM